LFAPGGMVEAEGEDDYYDDDGVNDDDGGEEVVPVSTVSY
jgi:hypothetical protein